MSFIVGTVGRMENIEAFVSAQATVKRVAGARGAPAGRRGRLGGVARLGRARRLREHPGDRRHHRSVHFHLSDQIGAHFNVPSSTRDS